ncbi:desulfurase [Bosea caraganae]|uniref:Desulfurase n=1 Tax=Bosea caraganae TaxID=2763117 RepID=A0A370L2K0_9HYPH|nr:acyl-CoA dehydrogenase family protein [Bosea caraganae]RDJ22419.1 desulfurase [Bosea caraganae]RDJ30378.1 desulfurase [Bosea caraganae]
MTRPLRKTEPAPDAFAIPLQARTPDDWLAITRLLAADFASHAAERERSKASPLPQLDQIRASGLSVLMIPKENGGGGADWPLATRIIHDLAAADGSLGVLFAYHSFNSVHLRRLSPERRSAAEREVAAKRLWLSGIANPRDGEISIAPVEGGFLLNGRKSFCTGALFADRLSVSGRRTDTGDIVRVLLPTDRTGIAYGNDWDSLGLQRTESGSFTLSDVRIAADEISAVRPNDETDHAASIHVPVNQSAFTAFYLGFARGAVDAARDYVQQHGRPWDGAARSQTEEPLILVQFGQAWSAYRAALALAERAAESVQELIAAGPRFTARQRGDTAIEVAAAKTQAIKVSLEVTAAIFDIMGARATGNRWAFDRFWRDARTHSLHDPLAYKLKEVGDFVLNGRHPPVGPYT